MRIALAQLNPTVGDVAGNAEKILRAIDQARAENADVLLGGELGLIGYPPRDLLLREGVVESCENAVHIIAEQTGDMTVLVGHPRRSPDGTGRLRNGCSVCCNGRVIAVYDKRLLPGYDVFDEDRYFEPGQSIGIIEIAGRRVGLLICEDLWRARDVLAGRRYPVDPVVETVEAGCEMILSLNASPFISGKWTEHIRHITALARRHRTPMVAVNQVGANDDLIFDGRSIVVDGHGSVVCRTEPWREGVTVIDPARESQRSEAGRTTNGSDGQSYNGHEVPIDESGDLFHALRLGLADYMGKTGHEKVVLGLSGGVDSALVATIAAAAVGPENVIGVLMPSRYSSPGSVTDAEELAANLGMEIIHTLPIRNLHKAMEEAVHPATGGIEQSVTDENIQARLRGVMLMAVSNTTGALTLSTSNKSEMAVGYTTLYGDMVGAVAVIADLLKTAVYDLSRWINAHFEKCGFATPPIPQSSIDKPPSAELRPDQHDQQMLPPYEILDEIIRRRIDCEQSVDRIVDEAGFDRELVEKTARMIDVAEFKRFQATVVLKVSPRTFGPGRPMPIVMKQTAMASTSQRGERRQGSGQLPLSRRKSE